MIALSLSKQKSKHISQYSPGPAAMLAHADVKRDMKRIKEMIETAPTKSMAMQMLETHRIFANITEAQYKKGRELIRKLF